MVLFAIALILTARLKFFESYKDHHLLGSFSLILLLIHPLSLALNLLSFSLSAAASFFIPTSDTLYILSGEISLLTMIILLVITFYFSLKYHVWKSTHQFLGLAFIIGFIHFLNVSSDVSSSPSLRIFYIILSSFAIVCYLYRTVFGKYLVYSFSYRLVAVNQLNSTHTELLMEPTGPKMNFYSGQFAFFQFFTPSVSTEPHPFSLASSPSEKYLRIVVKNLGDFTSTINQAKVGDLVKIEGPYGKFSPHFHSSHESIWIAGGVGITPFIGMSQDYKASLYYAFSNSVDAIFINQFKTNPNLSFYAHDSSINGRLTIDKIKEFKDKNIYLCGPPAMINGFKNQFIKLGVNPNRLISEDFQF